MLLLQNSVDKLVKRTVTRFFSIVTITIRYFWCLRHFICIFIGMRPLFLMLFLLVFHQATYSQLMASDETLAFQFYQQGEFDKAAVLFERLFTKSGEREAYFDYYFTSLLKVKNYADAEKLAKKMIKKSPENGVYQIALGRIYVESARKQLAEKAFETASEMVPADEFRVRDLANAFFKIESYDYAAHVFIKARKVLKDDKLFTFDLLSIYRFKKDKDKLTDGYITALMFMPELLFQTENILASVYDNDDDYRALQNILLKKLQKNPDQNIYTELLTWAYIQQKEYDMALRQLIAMDKRVGGKSTQIFGAAATFIANQAYPHSIKAYEYLVSKGKSNEYFLTARMELINTKYLLAVSGKYNHDQLKELGEEYTSILSEFGFSIRTLFVIKRLANLSAYYLNDSKEAENLLEKGLSLENISPQESGLLKLDLGDIYVLTNQPWDALLSYEQVAKQFENTPIGNEANYKAAKLSYFQGNFEYAKSQADVLKAATSQLIANDALNLSLLISDNLLTTTDSLALKMYADADLLQYTGKNELALLKLDSISLVYPGNTLADDVLMTKSRIFVSMSRFADAVNMLRKLTGEFSESVWADDALFMLGDLLENKLGEKTEAKVIYQKLITDYPGSLFAAESRKRFRNLRGDNL